MKPQGKKKSLHSSWTRRNVVAKTLAVTCKINWKAHETYWVLKYKLKTDRGKQDTKSKIAPQEHIIGHRASFWGHNTDRRGLPHRSYCSENCDLWGRQACSNHIYECGLNDSAASPNERRKNKPYLIKILSAELKRCNKRTFLWKDTRKQTPNKKKKKREQHCGNNLEIIKKTHRIHCEIIKKCQNWNVNEQKKGKPN